MRHRVRAPLGVLAAACVAAAVAGCGSAPAAVAALDVAMVHGVATAEPAVSPRPLAAADTGFGLDVMRDWCAENPGQNLVFSPSTLASALGMAYLGADGSTATAMARVLNLPDASRAALEAELQARITALGSLDGPGVTLAASDQLWADPTLKTLGSYLNAAAPGPFTPAGAKPVTVKFMNGDDFPYAAVGGWQAVSLPYQGGKLTMTALLPPAGSGSCALPSQASLTTIAGSLDGSAAGLADVSLPKVNLDTSGAAGDMKPALEQLGMGVAFAQDADFSSLSPQACCIGFVQQAATLQVGEKGTVGAAAAAVGVVAASSMAPERVVNVVFNRPYLLLITAKATGEPLFLAKVDNPAES